MIDVRHAAAAASLVAVTAGSALSPAPATASQDVVQQQLDRLVSRTGLPGAIATVRDGDGRVRTYTAGTGNLATGAPVPADSRVRIASNTKTFTAVVVLQLVAEGRVRLAA